MRNYIAAVNLFVQKLQVRNVIDLHTNVNQHAYSTPRTKRSFKLLFHIVDIMNVKKMALSIRQVWTELKKHDPKITRSSVRALLCSEERDPAGRFEKVESQYGLRPQYRTYIDGKQEEFSLIGMPEFRILHFDTKNLPEPVTIPTLSLVPRTDQSKDGAHGG